MTQNLSGNNVSSNLEVRRVQQEKQLLLIVLQWAVLKLLSQLIKYLGGLGVCTKKVRVFITIK